MDRPQRERSCASSIPCHWTVADHVQAVVDGGCRIVEVREHGESVEDETWMEADPGKLPAYLLVVGRKDSPGGGAGGRGGPR